MNNEFSEAIDDNYAQSASEDGNEESREEKEMREEKQAFLAPTRWWFASTAFPLVAGTFGPMASAFSIVALVIKWRTIVPEGGLDPDGIFVEDPEWLTAVEGVQLVLALISNFFLLMNMAKRVRFQIAQPITIIGWYISSLILIILCALTAGPLDAGHYTLSQGFYYATFAAGLYFLVASLLVVTYYGAHAGHYDLSFDLTTSQRTLMLQTIVFLVYLLSGGAVYARIEGWNYADAIYFADYTLLTVGIGNLAPSTHLGRSLVFPFAIGGIIILGLVIGSIRSLVLERGKVKMEARLVEKERERTLRRLDRKGKTSVLTPVSHDSKQTTTESSTSERERRRQEFELMRRVQKHAADRRRWMSLLVSAFVWFTLWFAGAAIFYQTESNQQGWSYFVSLYFAYISLLTIGYGDYYPVSNGGRAFFVFWSLLAIPSLTILISNMGDTVVKGVRDVVDYVASFTVLPRAKGVRPVLKELSHKLTGGQLFKGTFSEQPPGLLGETKRSSRVENGGKSHHRKDDPESAAGQSNERHKNADQSKATQRGAQNDNTARPKSKKHYHVMLVREIARVQRHLNDSPPRKYTFDEWAWYLKLIGEDEDDSLKHRRAPSKTKMDHVGLGPELDKGDRKRGEKAVQWSWVGTRSPLMGEMEEAEWVLKRLTSTLQRELVGVRKKETQQRYASGKGSKQRDDRDDSDSDDSEDDADDDYDLDDKSGREGLQAQGESPDHAPSTPSDGKSECGDYISENSSTPSSQTRERRQ